MFNTFNLNRLKTYAMNLSDRRAFIFSFALGFVIRLIPELLSYPNPIGFDTVYYAARTKSGVIWNDWTQIFSMWLLEGILISVNKIAQMNPFLLLKLAVPLLYGCNVGGIYYFSRKALNWRVKSALTAAFFFAFQLASLRLSWDLHRNLLGSGILLFTLPLINRVETKKNFAMLLTLSLLLVLSHILVSAVLFTIVFAVSIGNLLRRERLKSLKPSLAVLPAFAVLLMSLFILPTTSNTPENVIVSEGAVHPSLGGLYFLVNYFSVSNSVQSYSSYLDLVLHVFSLFGVLYLWWLPLVLVGFFRDRILGTWTLFLLFGSLNALITPFCAVNWWNRWMFMLVYPFTFFAANCVEKLSTFRCRSVVSVFRSLSWMKVTTRTVVGIFSITVVFGSIFLALPPFFDRFGLFFLPTTSSYLPSTMLYNSIPLRDVKPTIEIIEWLNKNMSRGSVVLLHRAFLWWADLYLDKTKMALYFERDIQRALEIALEHGFNPVYMVWWNENYLTWQNQNIGWYGLTVPNCFKYIFYSDRISVLRFDRLGE